MNLEKYKWKSRILFVSTPNYKEKKYLNVKKIYQEKIKEFHKRYIKLICKTDKKNNFSIDLIEFNGESKKKLDKLDYKVVFKTFNKMPLSNKIKPINLSYFQIIILKQPLKVWDIKIKKKLYTQLIL